MTKTSSGHAGDKHTYHIFSFMKIWSLPDFALPAHIEKVSVGTLARVRTSVDEPIYRNEHYNSSHHNYSRDVIFSPESDISRHFSGAYRAISL